MNKAEAKLFLLDLGTGAEKRSDRIDEMVTEMQQDADIRKAVVMRLRAELKQNEKTRLL